MQRFEFNAVMIGDIFNISNRDDVFFYHQSFKLSVNERARCLKLFRFILLYFNGSNINFIFKDFVIEEYSVLEILFKCIIY